MNDELEQLLKNLHLKKVLELFDEALAKAEKEGLPVEKLWARLLRAEWGSRQESALAWRIKNARMPEAWTLESFKTRPPSTLRAPPAIRCESR